MQILALLTFMYLKCIKKELEKVIAVWKWEDDSIKESCDGGSERWNCMEGLVINDGRIGM